MVLLRKRHFNVAHHVLPFGLGQTFNLAILLARGTPFVAGPVQSPHTFQDIDLQASGNGDRRAEHFARSALSKAAAYLSDLTLEKAQVVIVPHERTKQLLSGRLSDASKLVVIPMGIDTARFTPIASAKRKDKVVFLSPSLLIKRKNVAAIIRALPMLKDVQDRYHVRILGTGPELHSLEQLAAELGVTGCITFEGWVERQEIISIYQQSDVMLSMSRSESFSNICLEAMASGLTVLATQVGAFQDAVEHNISGFLIEQDDHEALAKNMLSLIEDPARLRRMQGNARKKMIQNYDWDKVIIPQFMQVYDSLSK
jgi:glycosyltransferase involved in cell wall biosynthesis